MLAEVLYFRVIQFPDTMWELRKTHIETAQGEWRFKNKVQEKGHPTKEVNKVGLRNLCMSREDLSWKTISGNKNERICFYPFLFSVLAHSSSNPYSGLFGNNRDNAGYLDTFRIINEQYSEDSEPHSLWGILKSIDILGNRMNDSVYVREDSEYLEVYIRKKGQVQDRNPLEDKISSEGPYVEKKTTTLFLLIWYKGRTS